MTAKHHFRGFVRVSDRHPRKMQQDALARYNCVMHYADEGEGLDDLIRGLRKGDVVVCTTLARLASRRVEIMDAIKRIHAKGAVVIEATTGRKSTDKGEAAMQMMADAVAELIGDSRAVPLKKLREYGKKAWTKRLAKRTSEEAASRVWHSTKYQDLSNTAVLAMDEMYGWTQETAYRRLGKRNLLAGRRRNKD